MEENFIEKKKKSNPLLYILVLIIGIAIGVGGFFGYTKVFVKSGDITNCVTKDNVVDKSDDKVNADSNSSFSLNNAFSNSLEYGDDYLDSQFAGRTFHAVLNGSDLKKANIFFNTNDIGGYLTSQRINISVKGDLSGSVILPKPIVYIIPDGNVEFGGAGYASYFLLNDGTVYALDVINALKSVDFNTGVVALPEPKLIEGLDDVVSIKKVNIYPKVGGGQGISGVGCVAIKSNGSVVPLSAK